LHSSRLPALVNHPDMKTLYFPFSQWVFLLGYKISGEGIWGYKLLLLFAEMATIAGLFLLTVHTGIPRKFALLYALCPLPVMAFAVDAHLDGFGLPLMIFGLLLQLRGKKAAALLLFALSISVKPVALVFLPVLFVLEKGLWQKTRTLLIPVAVLLLQFLPYSTGASPLDSLEIFAKHWAFNGSMFELVNLYLADNQKARYVCAFLLGFTILLLSLSRKELVEKIYLSVFLLLLFSPVVHPWYVAWLAVLLPLERRWSGLVFVSAVSLALCTVVTYKATGVWTQYPLLLLLEYLPVIGLLGLELRGSLPSLPLEPGA
jgi:alpha-1,6-mannosyltransferase